MATGGNCFFLDYAKFQKLYVVLGVIKKLLFQISNKKCLVPYSDSDTDQSSEEISDSQTLLSSEIGFIWISKIGKHTRKQCFPIQ